MKPYYADESVTLYHGDCREVLPMLPSRQSVVLTDPPFSVPVKYHDTDGDFPRSWGDLAIMEPFFRDVFDGIRKATDPRSQVYVCCDCHSYPVFYKAALPIWSQSDLIVWYKPTGRRGRGWKKSSELILHTRTTQTVYRDVFQQNVIGIMPVRTLEREHPAEKPGDLWAFLLEVAPSELGVVLDPFMGSGSALVTARAQQRQAIGIEIEERYCEIAANRLRQGALTEMFQ